MSPRALSPSLSFLFARLSSFRPSLASTFSLSATLCLSVLCPSPPLLSLPLWLSLFLSLSPPAVFSGAPHVLSLSPHLYISIRVRLLLLDAAAPRVLHCLSPYASLQPALEGEEDGLSRGQGEGQLKAMNGSARERERERPKKSRVSLETPKERERERMCVWVNSKQQVRETGRWTQKQRSEFSF